MLKDEKLAHGGCVPKHIQLLECIYLYKTENRKISVREYNDNSPENTKASKNVTADGISVNHAAGVKEDRVSALCELCNRLQWLICFSRDRKKN